MGKLVILSVLIGMVAAPVLAAREPDARRGLRKAFALTLAADVLYLLALRFILPRVGL